MTAPPDMEKLYKDLSVAFWSGPLRSDEYERYLVRSAYAAGAAAERERCKGLVALASSPTVRDRSWICSPRAVVESFDAVEPAAPTATAEPTSTWQRVNGQWQCQECGTLRDFRPPDPCDFCSDAKQPEPARPLTLEERVDRIAGLASAPLRVAIAQLARDFAREALRVSYEGASNAARVEQWINAAILAAEKGEVPR